jgi:ABC-type phosphate/phosphonate transport system substrate-binding protein
LTLVQETEFRFGLPPSLGKEPVFEMAREFADVLYGAGFTSVIPYKSYEALQQALFAGDIDAAWGPPVICARVEAAGGVIAQRAIRRGSTTYRSALVNRRQDRWDLSVVRSGAFRPRAVWVDEWSMGGYLLARAQLRREGVELNTQLLNERWLGSYTACFDSLNEYDGDITASFVGTAGGLETIWGSRVERLHILVLSEESPNDGIVLAPKLEERRVLALRDSLQRVLDSRASHQVLCQQFSVEGFDIPPQNTYAPLIADVGWTPMAPDDVPTAH